mgnify:CR=1 FL=1
MSEDNLVEGLTFDEWCKKNKKETDESELRDKFAGLAMQSILLEERKEGIVYGYGYEEDGDLTRRAYKIADDMIKARANNH